MKNSIKTLIIGEPTKHLSEILASFKSMQITKHSLSESNSSVIGKIIDEYDLVIITLIQDTLKLLTDLDIKPTNASWALLIFGPHEDAQILRQAMQLGARDYLTVDTGKKEIATSLEKIIEQLHVKKTDNNKIISTISAHSGLDSLFIAANLAHIIAHFSKQKTIIVDMHLQFSALALLFDVRIKRSISEALQTVSTLDQTALQGFVTNHQSGIDIMSIDKDEIIIPEEISRDQFEQFVQLMHLAYQNSYFILANQLDTLSSVILSESNMILIPMHQNVASLFLTKKLYITLTRELLINEENIHIIVHPFVKSYRITKSDICKTIGVNDVMTLPEDMNLVRESIDAGVPINDYAKSSSLNKALIKLAQDIHKIEFSSGSGFLKKSVSSLELFTRKTG